MMLPYNGIHPFAGQQTLSGTKYAAQTPHGEPPATPKRTMVGGYSFRRVPLPAIPYRTVKNR